MIHIFTETKQPLTQFVDNHFDKPHWSKRDPLELFTCHDCGRKRFARDLCIQVYYDGWRIFCREREYARSLNFPFAYERVCQGATFDTRKEIITHWRYEEDEFPALVVSR